MELATIELKLCGNPQNTVIKHNVTPSELSVYAFMHGEDCVDGVTITGKAPERTIGQEMDRLRTVFATEEASKALNKLFPGMAPPLLVTFSSLGYRNFAMPGQNDPMNQIPQPNNDAEAAIQRKIAAADEQRRAEAEATQTSPVYPGDIAAVQSELDDTGGVLDMTDQPDFTPPAQGFTPPPQGYQGE